ncbi:hypothetical protein [Pseudobacteriovorax antillogorgiicola]|uniref:Uncharacterized protein n=1 Tax=Pseudobacteriovorax antillogorgiicola TaxID=1513793 RepID=A0A1Y6BFH4_9BACT|nr:hypothetical protein [Pseudobacteriovorax antillogorgiicola]TCS56213.1 hypothetical protein EDD56_10435 [Pseudobacteriovorax antillogorgiicola]SMF08476.1 hypothetical protein SAMN06296036_104299 [Pseudobacteriovorax antillogorgiicola]
MKQHLVVGLMTFASISCTAKSNTQEANRTKSKGAQFAAKAVISSASIQPSLENLCMGLTELLNKTKQDFANEVAILCPNGLPSEDLQRMMDNPYQGSGNVDNFIRNLDRDDLNNDEMQVKFYYGIKMTKDIVKTVIKEEPIAVLPYNGSVLKIQNAFMEPPKNLGDSNSAFLVQQFIDVNNERRDVKFNDTSLHDLKVYQLFPDNFNFFLAARTQVEVTEQFKRSVVLKAFLTDPQNPNMVYGFNLVNMVMNDRGGGNVEDGQRDEFMQFFEISIRESYQEHMKDAAQ